MTASVPRVIFVNRVYQPSQAATAQLLTDLAESLAAAGWDVQVVATGDRSGTLNGVTVHRTGPDEHPPGLISRARNYWRFIQLARAQISQLVQPGDRVVVMSDPPMLGAALAESVIQKGASLIHWVQDIYPEILSAHIGSWSEVPLAPLTLKRNAAWLAAQCCVVLGNEMAATLSNQKIPAPQIVVVPNWAPRELQERADAAARAAHRSTWGLADKFIVAYSGNLGRVHEFETVVAAAEILRSRTDIVFLFIGSGARLRKLQTNVQSRQLANIQFRPPEPRENLAVSLGSADVQLVTLKPAFSGLVYPSKLAGVLAAGRPVIFVGPREGEIPELLRSAKCGDSVAPGEASRLAELIVQWQAKSTLRDVQLSARTAYETYFTFARALTRWKLLLSQAKPKD